MFADPIVLARIQFGLNIGFHILFPTHHDRACLGARVPACAHRVRGGRDWLAGGLPALGQDLRAVVRARRGVRHHDELPVRHQLAGFHGAGRQHRRTAAGLRGAHRILPRSHVPGRDAVRPRPRAGAGCTRCRPILVAIGTTASAFWILALNSWMQTPQGFTIVDGQLHALDWMAIIFNPSFPYRFTHMMIASGLTVAFLIAGISAFQLLRNRDFEPAPRMFRNRRAARGGARAGADRGRRPARAEHARAPAGQDRRHRRRSGTPSAGRRCCCSRCPNRETRSATTTPSPSPRVRA